MIVILGKGTEVKSALFDFENEFEPYRLRNRIVKLFLISVNIFKHKTRKDKLLRDVLSMYTTSQYKPSVFFNKGQIFLWIQKMQDCVILITK